MSELQNSVQRLFTLLQQQKYPGLLEPVLFQEGSPAAQLPILHQTLTNYSKHVATFIQQLGFELYTKSDQRFIETIQKLLRNEFNYRPGLSISNFLSMGFARLKADMCFEILKIMKILNTDLIRKEKNRALKTKIYSKRELSNTRQQCENRTQVIRHVTDTGILNELNNLYPDNNILRESNKENVEFMLPQQPPSPEKNQIINKSLSPNNVPIAEYQNYSNNNIICSPNIKQPVIIKHNQPLHHEEDQIYNNNDVMNFNQMILEQMQQHSLTINKLVEAVDNCNCYINDCNTRIVKLNNIIDKQQDQHDAQIVLLNGKIAYLENTVTNNNKDNNSNQNTFNREKALDKNTLTNIIAPCNTINSNLLSPVNIANATTKTSFPDMSQMSFAQKDELEDIGNKSNECVDSFIKKIQMRYEETQKLLSK